MVFCLGMKKRVMIGAGVLGLLLMISPVIRACSALSSVPEGLDRPPEFNEVRYSPEDGDRTATNPPAFIWLPVDEVDRYIVQYSRDASFPEAQTVTVRDLRMTVHIPTETVEPGSWYWRYGFEHDGRDHFSRVRAFEIPEDAVDFPLPSADKLMDRVPDERPRLYFSPELVEKVRNDSDGYYAHLTEPVIREAEEILAREDPLYEEPDDWPIRRTKGYWTPEERAHYLHTFRSLRPFTRGMFTTALAWLYTGDERFAEEARRRLMHFMTWDMEASSSTVFPDEVGMDIAENATPVFDWIYDYLSPEEREKCIEILTARMMQIYRDVHLARPMDSRPYYSHEGRMVAFTIEGGIVLADESPEEAREWLDYTLRLLWSTYPSWGGDDGGWHEGVSYWGGYLSRIFRVVAELDRYGIPLKNKPFFRNTSYFGLYVAYPGRPTRAFGDGAHLPLSENRAGIITYMAANIYDNPWFRWHAEMTGVLPYGRKAIRFYNPHMEARSPSDLPYSRAFYDVGLVAMHSDMPNPDNNIFMLFKSNPFGAMSHNHASQNAFVIEAFGEALALSTGARLNHGEAHHVEWIRHTKAHNSILVDHEGQTVRRREESSGRIIAYEETGDYAYTVGDATRAYGGKLERFHRHVLYLRPDVYIIFDDLKTSDDPSTFQWLLHGPTTIDVDPERRVMVTRSGNARLISRHLYPEGLAYEQHTGFTPNVVDPDRWRNQFHLTASTTEPSGEQYIVTVMKVDRFDGPPVHRPDPPSTERRTMSPGEWQQNAPDEIMTQIEAEFVPAQGGAAVRIGDDLILIRARDADRVTAAGTQTAKDFEVWKNFY